MEDLENKSISVSRPKDTSLDGYKDWIMELCQRLTTKEVCILLTEEEWTANWEAYWQEQAAG